VRALAIDAATRASDHQPVMLELGPAGRPRLEKAERIA
jgi:hypothetical protein